MWQGIMAKSGIYVTKHKHEHGRIDDQGKQPKGKEVDRERENEHDWSDNGVHDTKDTGGENPHLDALYADSFYEDRCRDQGQQIY